MNTMLRWLLILLAFVLGCEIGTNIICNYDVDGAQAGIIFEDVILEDGATDGDDSYFKIGNDLLIIAKPGSHEFNLIKPLKGKRVRFELRLQ